MKHFSIFRSGFLITFLFFLTIRLSAQDQYFIQIDSTLDGGFNSALRDTAGDFLCFHYPISTGAIREFISLDSTGQVQWIKDYTLNNSFFENIKTSDGNYILMGIQIVSSNNYPYIWKITPQGNTVWFRRIYQGTASIGYSIAPTYDGGCVMTGSSTSSRFFFVRLDGSGNIIVQKKLNITVGNNGYCKGLLRTADSCYVGTMNVNYGANDADIWMYKIDLSGTLLWVRAFDAQYGNDPMWIVPAHDGGYIIVGKSSAYNSSAGRNVALLRVDSAGHLLWAKAYPHFTLGATTPYDVVEMPDHGIMVPCMDGTASFVLRMDSVGNLLWTKGLNNNFIYNSRSVVSNGGIYLFGDYTFTSGAKRPAFIRLKDDSLLFCSTTQPAWFEYSITAVESSPTITTTNVTFTNAPTTMTYTVPVTPGVRTLLCTNIITGESNEIKSGNSVSVFPNPSDGNMLIHCEQNLQNASFTVMGINGEIIETKENVNGQDISINVAEWAPGMYFFRICNGTGEIQTGKLLVIQ